MGISTIESKNIINALIIENKTYIFFLKERYRLEYKELLKIESYQQLDENKYKELVNKDDIDFLIVNPNKLDKPYKFIEEFKSNNPNCEIILTCEKKDMKNTKEHVNNVKTIIENSPKGQKPIIKKMHEKYKNSI